MTDDVKAHRKEPRNPGPATDVGGNPVLDPTANVLGLVEAAMQRQDDLRKAADRRQDDLREAAKLHSKEMAALRAEFQRQMLESEANRLDAIRAVDVQAVQQKALEAETRATALANQVTAAAEAMRNQVAAAATAAATALSAALEPVQKDIADLRRAQYEAQGQKTQVVETQAQGASVGTWIGLAIGGISLLVAAVAVIALLSTQGGNP